VRWSGVRCGAARRRAVGVGALGWSEALYKGDSGQFFASAEPQKPKGLWPNCSAGSPKYPGEIFLDGPRAKEGLP
jgi:hypothetical protein